MFGVEEATGASWLFYEVKTSRLLAQYSQQQQRDRDTKRGATNGKDAIGEPFGQKEVGYESVLIFV